MRAFGSAANVFSVLFFVVLLSLGLDSTFAWAETFNSYIDDALIAYGRPQPKWKITVFSSALLFLVGLPFCTRMGSELLDVVDHYVRCGILEAGSSGLCPTSWLS